ncbi:hypothetical protein B0H17DRAFT_1182370 [Mycena rosella]|uniref:Uncharacterized protein n=1 Tax=Mycena rosella TaxID=1033263 RepID=A0AAD7GCP6_MYCRO|nr:hypothetical protein B0H17DRAFT_1182370 [Mycena rosella]
MGFALDTYCFGNKDELINFTSDLNPRLVDIAVVRRLMIEIRSQMDGNKPRKLHVATGWRRELRRAADVAAGKEILLSLITGRSKRDISRTLYGQGRRAMECSHGPQTQGGEGAYAIKPVDRLMENTLMNVNEDLGGGKRYWLSTHHRVSGRRWYKTLHGQKSAKTSSNLG